MPPLPRLAPPGSTVAVVSPASPPETRAEVDRGIAWWKANGYDVELAPSALARDDWHAGSPEQRARDLQDAFADPGVDVIQCMRGGYGSAQVIPLLDLEAIASAPKALVGMSDQTALHCALARAGVPSLYGPSLTGMGGADELTAARLLDVLARGGAGPMPLDSDRLTPLAIAPGAASGRLAGGCLSDLIHTLGTPWEADLDGALLFFEEVGRAPIQIDRALLHLEQAGKLAGVRGVAVGELAGCEWDDWPTAPRSKTLEEVLEARLGQLGVPVLYGVPVGHGAVNATLPLGVRATVDANALALALTIDEPALG